MKHALVPIYWKTLYSGKLWTSSLTTASYLASIAVFFALSISQAGYGASPLAVSVPAVPLSAQKPMTAQRVIGAFWRTDQTFSSTIRITNHLSIATLSITPILYMADGAEYDLEPIDVAPSSLATIDVNQALRTVPIDLLAHVSTYGSAALKYSWRWRAAISASIISLDNKRSLTFSSLFVTPSDAEVSYQSFTAEGIWWKPTNQVEGFVSLSNTTESSLNTTVELVDHQGEAFNTTYQSVAKKATILLNLADLISQSSHETMGGIRVKYDGGQSSLVVSGGVQETSRGYSATIPFLIQSASQMDSMEQTEHASSFAFTGLMTGTQSPMMKFPVGSIFRPFSFARNVSKEDVTIQKAISYEIDGQPVSVNLGLIRMKPNETVSLLPKQLPRVNGTVTLVLRTDAPSGTIITAAGSVDQTGTYVFEVLPQALSVTEAKQFPYWNTSGGNDTMINLWNASSQAQDLIVTVFAGSSQYKYPIHLLRNGSTMVSIKELQETATPDLNGNVLPRSMTTGSGLLSASDETSSPLNVVASVGTFNVLTATCGTTCPTCLGYVNYFIASDPFYISPVPGATTHVDAYAQNTQGGIHPVTGQSSWASSNNGVATVQSPGTFGSVSTGSFSGTAMAILISPDSSGCTSGQPCPTDQFSYSAQGTVTQPTASRIVQQLQSFAISSSSTTGYTCGPNQAGWYRQVRKIVTDQNGADIAASGQYLNETVTIGSPNDLGITGVITNHATTDGAGNFLDELFVCSSVCPQSSGKTVATQAITDSYQNKTYSLTANTFTYSCSGNTINGQ